MNPNKDVVRRSCKRRTDLGAPECSEPWVFSDAGVRGGCVLPPAPRERWCSACQEGKFVGSLLFALVYRRLQELEARCRWSRNAKLLQRYSDRGHASWWRHEMQRRQRLIGWWCSTWGAR